MQFEHLTDMRHDKLTSHDLNPSIERDYEEICAAIARKSIVNPKQSCPIDTSEFPPTTQFNTRETDETQNGSFDKAEVFVVYFMRRLFAFLLDGACSLLLSSALKLFSLLAFDFVWQFTPYSRTPGKLLFNLRVVDKEGHDLTPWRKFYRVFLKNSSLIISFCLPLQFQLLAFLCAVVTFRRRTFYDYLSGAYVVSTEKVPAQAFYPRSNLTIGLVCLVVFLASLAALPSVSPILIDKLKIIKDTISPGGGFFGNYGAGDFDQHQYVR